MIDYSLHFNNVVDFNAKLKSALLFLSMVQFEGEGNGFSSVIEMFSPDLLNSSYCEDLGNGFEQEIRENFHRFIETKRQDRYSEELFSLLKLSLDRAFRTIKKYHTFTRNADYQLIDSDGALINGKALEDATAIDESLKNLNKIRLPIHSLLKSNAPEEWQKYRNALNPVNQVPQPIESGVNQTITWNLNASVLYDIFAQLLKMTLPNGSTPISREGRTVKHLAAIIHQNIHFVKGNSPTLDQIERELQKMSVPDSVGAKRDKITIVCKSEPDTE